MTAAAIGSHFEVARNATGGEIAGGKTPDESALDVEDPKVEASRPNGEGGGVNPTAPTHPALAAERIANHEEVGSVRSARFGARPAEEPARW